MKKFIKNIFNNSVGLLEKKDTKTIIEEIHNSFDIAGEQLLKEATAIIEKGINGNPKKAELLKKVGFTNTKEFQDFKTEQTIIKINKDIAEDIQYFQVNYPNNKVITENMVIKICEKYNLVKGPIAKYKGFVPDSKLTQIAQFELKKEDYSYIKENINFFGSKSTYISIEQFLEYSKNPDYHTIYRKEKPSLEICAPLKDMDTKGMELKGRFLFKIEIPDPIVLQPVNRNDKTYYLILAAWGDEVSDELVVNNKMN